eukprot:6936045-Pyramimonas_sp.AAC.1
MALKCHMCAADWTRSAHARPPPTRWCDVACASSTASIITNCAGPCQAQNNKEFDGAEMSHARELENMDCNFFDAKEIRRRRAWDEEYDDT